MLEIPILNGSAMDKKTAALVEYALKHNPSISVLRDIVESAYRAQRNDTIRQIVEWGNEECPHCNNPNYFRPKHLCPECWRELEGVPKCR